MAYNWNAALCQQRKHRLMMQMSLGASALTFIFVIAALAYYLSDLGVTNSARYFSQTTWPLRG